MPKLPKDSLGISTEGIISENSFFKFKMKGMLHSEFQYIKDFQKERRKNATKKSKQQEDEEAEENEEVEGDFETLQNQQAPLVDDFEPLQVFLILNSLFSATSSAR
jgi:hypothetical protein